jgi:hypothetical protein
MVKAFLRGLLIAAVAVPVFGPVLADPPPTYPPDLDLSASVWAILNNGATLHNDSGGGLYFDFPVQSDTTCKATGTCPFVNYLYTTHVPTSVSGIISVTLHVDVTGTPVFQNTSANPSCTETPAVRAMIWAHNNNLSDGNRWWSNPISYVLAPGSVTMNIPIDPAWWSGVKGQRATDDLTKWEHAITSVSSLALTFGASCTGFGHGAFVVGGTARFTIDDYEVEPTPSCPSVSPCNGINCVTGGEISDTNTNLYQCLDASNTLAACTYPQSFHVVGTTCRHAPCCTANPPCICFQCPNGSSLECR